MSSLKAWFQSVRLRRTVFVFVSGLFLFMSTACGSQQPPLSSTGGSLTGTEVETFADDAKSNVMGSVQDLKQSVEDYSDRTQQNLSRIGDYAQDKAEDAVENAQNAATNAASQAKARATDLKENVEDLAS